MRNRFLLVAFLVVVGLGSTGQAFADELFIGSPTCPAPPGCPVFGTEVNGLTGNTITIHETGNKTPLNPLLLIIGVPNATSFTAPAITLSAGTGTIDGAQVYPSNTTKWGANGFVGSFTSGSVYQFIGLVAPAGGSENFGNWSAADAAVLGITASSFGILVYELNNTGLHGGSSVDVTFASGLPVGTFIVGYGCTELGINGSCSTDGKFGTPFTQAGLVVPEPGTLALFGTGLLGLAAAIRRRLRG